MVVRLDPNDPSYPSRNQYDSESTPSFISSLGGFVNPDLLGRSDEDELHLESRGEEEDGPQAESEPQAPVLSLAREYSLQEEQLRIYGLWRYKPCQNEDREGDVEHLLFKSFRPGVVAVLRG